MRQHLLAVAIGSVLLAGASVASAEFAVTSVKAPSAIAVPDGDPSLYSQLDNASGNGGPDQNFEAIYDAYDSDAADDFVIPAGPDNWSITQVVTTGTFTGADSPVTVNISFYPDAGGVPGAAAACSYSAVTPNSIAGGSYFITLPTPCVLGPGSYWLGLQTNLDFGVGGQHFWSTRSVQSNSLAVWRNPGDGFGTGCTSFTPFASCGTPPVGGGFPDLLFQLNGNLVAAPALVPPAVIPTLGSLGLLALALSLGGLAWFRSRHST